MALPRLPFDFKKPDYAAVLKARMVTLRRLRETPEAFKQLRAYYAAGHYADFINDWGVTFDPRNAERGLPTLIPFVLFPKQREWVDYVLRKWRAQEPGLCEKSRDMGVSWLAMALSCTLCLFNDGVVIGVGSRKTIYVDKVGEHKPLLPKARIFMENLPAEFRGDWQAWRDAPNMRVMFPATGSLISGEGGDDIGRGDRTSIYFVDEAQPLDAKLLTPSGWTTMADIKVGDQVIGADGRPTKVTAINDAGVHDIIRVTMSDGTTVECSPNHKWTVEKVIGARRSLTLRASEIMERFKYESPGGQTQYIYRVPVCNAVQFNSQKNALHPYLVGAMLGDGGFSCGVMRITTADREIVDSFAALLPEGIGLGHFDGRYSYNIVDLNYRKGRTNAGYPTSAARDLFRDIGVVGVRSWEKSIPDCYKLASVEDRLALLQGLMDTDGSATGGKAALFTSSLRLAQDVRFLVQSLGGTAWWNVKTDARGYRDQYALQIAMPVGMCPFRLSRKKGAFKERKHPFGRTIVAMEIVGCRPVRCITVEAKDGLYLTDNCIVTHNSAHLEHPEKVDAALSQTTNCRIDMSSVRGMANPFAKKRWGGKIEPFIFDWRDDPRKDDAWYKKQCETLDPVVVAQEIDRDYLASVKGVVIPGTWVRSAIGAKRKLGIAPSGIKRIAFDVADEGDDLDAVCVAEGTTVLFTDEWSGKGGDVFESTELVFDYCDEHGVTEFRYDADGIGAGVRGDARVINERRKAANARPIRAVGYRGSEAVFNPDGIVEGTIGLEGDKGRTNKDYFANRKAQAWWGLRKRFQRTHRWVTQGIACPPDDIIDLDDSKDTAGNARNPMLMKLVAELSQATYRTNELGKIVIEKKPSGVKSPNLADAVVIDFAEMESGPVEITSQMLLQIASGGRGRRR